MNIPQARQLILDAMGTLQNASMGAIGESGATQQELNAAAEAGMVCEDNSDYHTMQQAWLYLERAMKELEK